MKQVQEMYRRLGDLPGWQRLITNLREENRSLRAFQDKLNRARLYAEGFSDGPTDEVEVALKRHPKGGNYRLGVKYNQIVVYERLGPDIDMLKTIFGVFGPKDRRAGEILDHSAQRSTIWRKSYID